VIVFVSVDDLSKLPNVPRDNGLLPYFHQICAIFVDDVPPKLNIDVEQVSLDLMSESDQTTLIWEKAVKYLRFPPKVNTKIKNCFRFNLRSLFLFFFFFFLNSWSV
jgi:hypothetical protein